MPQAPILNNTYIKVEHLSLDSGNANTEGYVADAGLAAVPVNIQPTAPEMVALFGGAYGKAYTAFTSFTTASGILETDRVTTVSGTTSQVFIVRGKQNFNYGLARHLEFYLEETE